MIALKTKSPNIYVENIKCISLKIELQTYLSPNFRGVLLKLQGSLYKQIYVVQYGVGFTV